MPLEAAPFLNWGIAISLVMAVVWAFRIKSRGVGALPMMAAFLCFALLLGLLRERASQGLVVAAGVVLFALLVLDALMRSASRGGQK